MVDANVLLAAFLKEAVTRELLLDSRLTLYAPEHLLAETSRHLAASSALRKRIRISAAEIRNLFALLTGSIHTIPKDSYGSQMDRAFRLAPHEEDAPYLAVALLLGIPVWSNDRGLKEQSAVKVLSTPELVQWLGRNMRI